jgi:hypothetical protein
MAKRQSRATAKAAAGSRPVNLSMKGLKLHARENIALLKKATSFEGYVKTGSKKGITKEAAIRKLEGVLKTIDAICGSMGVKVTFR